MPLRYIEVPIADSPWMLLLYNKSERPALAKRDAKHHRLAVAGFIVLGLAFVLQIAAPLVE